MSARVPLHLRRGLAVGASIVALHALIILLCYAVPPVQNHSATQHHRFPRALNHPEREVSQKQNVSGGRLNVSMLTVTMTGCSKAADWQALGLYHSFLR